MNYLNDFMKDKGDTPIALVSTDKEFPGIIYTRVSNTPLDTDGLMLIQQVESKQNADAVQSSSRPVTIKDIFEPHSNQLNGSTLCKLISDNTSQNLETLSYIVNGNNNPGYVLNECINIHSKIYLSKTLSRNSADIMMLLDDKEYEAYCASRFDVYPTQLEKFAEKKKKKPSKEKPSYLESPDKFCERTTYWMKSNEDKEPKPICKFVKGSSGFFTGKSDSCVVDTQQRDKIKKTLQKKISKCIADMGCLTGTYGENPTQKRYMRRHTGENFKNSIPTQICCKRSLKAVAKAALRMDRLYEYLGNMSYDEQMKHVNKSALSESEKKLFLSGIRDSHSVSEKLIRNLNVDNPTRILMESFSIIVRNGIREAFEEFVTVQNVDVPKTEKDAQKNLDQITGSEETSSYLMSILKSAASTVIKALTSVAHLLYKTISYFMQKGFDLLKWLFNHPTTAMWMTYTCLFLKKKVCEFVSLRIYGDPEMIEVGLLQRTKDFASTAAEYTSETATLIKKNFLATTYDFLGSSMFTSFVNSTTILIESGILYVIALIPIYGVVLSTTIKASGGLTVILSSAGYVIGEAMYYGFTAMMLKEAGDDLYSIITGTCIKKPEQLHQLTVTGILSEAASAKETVIESVSSAKDTILNTGVNTASFAAETANGFFKQLNNLLPSVL
jgi:hypothetical protein